VCEKAVGLSRRERSRARWRAGLFPRIRWNLYRCLFRSVCPHAGSRLNDSRGADVPRRPPPFLLDPNPARNERAGQDRPAGAEALDLATSSALGSGDLTAPLPLDRRQTAPWRATRDRRALTQRCSRRTHPPLRADKEQLRRVSTQSSKSILSAGPSVREGPDPLRITATRRHARRNTPDVQPSRDERAPVRSPHHLPAPPCDGLAFVRDPQSCRPTRAGPCLTYDTSARQSNLQARPGC
jgi:hypothetical protein